MSEFFLGITSGSLPPSVPTQFTADDATTAIPSGNNLYVLSRDVSSNNDNGIRTKADPNLSDNLYIELTNRLQGSGSTVGATTADIITFTPTVIGTYDFEFRTAAYNTTSSIGAGYKVYGAIRFDGVNSNLCGTPNTIDSEEGAMSACDIDIVVPGGPSVVLRVTGYALQTINWGAVGEYTFRGV